jgi:hypothetical protein
MSRPIIFARSPFFETINETNSKGSKVELWIWKSGETEPVAPTYIFQKLIPSPAKHTMTYDLSSYIQEYFTFTHPYTDIDLGTWWCNVRVKSYNLDSTNTYIEVSDKYYYAFNGYQNIELNPMLQGFSDNPFILNTNYLINNDFDYVYGQFQPLYFVNYGGGTITYLIGETSGSVTIPNDNPYCFGSYFWTYSWTGNVSITISLDDFSYTWNFKQVDDCNNNGVIWYINAQGVWESTNTKGSIKSSINTTSSEYQLINENYGYGDYLHNGYIGIAEKQILNLNGTRNITVNTNWKTEKWNIILQEIMLSEKLYFGDVNNRIFLDSTSAYPLPYKLNTKTIQLNRHLTDKLINYQLELELLQSLVYTQY